MHELFSHNAAISQYVSLEVKVTAEEIGNIYGTASKTFRIATLADSEVKSSQKFAHLSSPYYKPGLPVLVRLKHKLFTTGNKANEYETIGELGDRLSLKKFHIKVMIGDRVLLLNKDMSIDRNGIVELDIELNDAAKFVDKQQENIIVHVLVCYFFFRIFQISNTKKKWSIISFKANRKRKFSD